MHGRTLVVKDLPGGADIQSGGRARRPEWPAIPTRHLWDQGAAAAHGSAEPMRIWGASSPSPGCWTSSIRTLPGGDRDRRYSWLERWRNQDSSTVTGIVAQPRLAFRSPLAIASARPLTVQGQDQVPRGPLDLCRRPPPRRRGDLTVAIPSAKTRCGRTYPHQMRTGVQRGDSGPRSVSRRRSSRRTPGVKRRYSTTAVGPCLLPMKTVRISPPARRVALPSASTRQRRPRNTAEDPSPPRLWRKAGVFNPDARQCGADAISPTGPWGGPRVSRYLVWRPTDTGWRPSREHPTRAHRRPSPDRRFNMLGGSTGVLQQHYPGRAMLGPRTLLLGHTHLLARPFRYAPRFLVQHRSIPPRDVTPGDTTNSRYLWDRLSPSASSRSFSWCLRSGRSGTCGGSHGPMIRGGPSKGHLVRFGWRVSNAEAVTPR